MNEVFSLLGIIFFCFLLRISSFNESEATVLETDEKKRNENKTKQKVIMHVGPHKTGSTHIHAYIEKISDSLPSVSYCWPVTKGNVPNKSNMLAVHFLENRSVHNKSIQWLNNCMKTSQNIIISSEAFDRFSLDKFIEFRNYLSDFDFEIVIIYREWLNHMYSLYTELHKHTSKGTSFSEYLFQNLDLFEESPVLNLSLLIAAFEPVVGIQNIHVLDYYGIIAAEKDEAYVIVCEIMGVRKRM